MVAPTFKKATDTAAGDSTKYGAPDLKYAFDVLDGTHSTDRIQGSVIEHNPKPFDVIVYISGSTVYARRGSTGALVSSSSTSTPETAIQAAINEGPGHIYIDSGTYNFSAGFTGLKIDNSYTRVTMAPDCWLKVPATYTGACFLLNTTRDGTTGLINGTVNSMPGGVSNTRAFQGVILEGGIISDQAEASTQARSWTGVRLYASTSGTYQNTLRNLHINHCSTGIELLMDNNVGGTGTGKGTQWLNNNQFEDIWIADPVIGVDFKVHASVTPSAGYPYNYNVFKHVIIQAGNGSSPRTTPTHGFKDIRTIQSTFVGCISYDFTGTSKRSTIHTTGWRTLIIGGTITDVSSSLYTDQGEETLVIDPAQTNVSGGAFTLERYGTANYPATTYRHARGTKASPTVPLAGDVLADLANVMGWNTSVYKNAAKLTLKAADDFTTSNHSGYIDFQLSDYASGTAVPTSKFHIYPWGDLTMLSGASLWFDGFPSGNTRIYEAPADNLNIAAGGTVDFQATATHALTKAFSGASDPTTTNIPAGFFTVAKNTTSGAVKLFYNDAGTLKSVTLT